MITNQIIIKLNQIIIQTYSLIYFLLLLQNVQERELWTFPVFAHSPTLPSPPHNIHSKLHVCFIMYTFFLYLKMHL